VSPLRWAISQNHDQPTRPPATGTHGLAYDTTNTSKTPASSSVTEAACLPAPSKAAVNAGPPDSEGSSTRPIDAGSPRSAGRSHWPQPLSRAPTERLEKSPVAGAPARA